MVQSRSLEIGVKLMSGRIKLSHEVQSIIHNTRLRSEIAMDKPNYQSYLVANDFDEGLVSDLGRS